MRVQMFCVYLVLIGEVTVTAAKIRTLGVHNDHIGSRFNMRGLK